MKTILILGHHGMLGNAVFRYFDAKRDAFTPLTIPERWGDATFREALAAAKTDVIINCIGSIPQKKPTDAEYQKMNVELPVFLETLGTRVIHPSTDCEFSGKISAEAKYSKTDVRDAEDAYGKSKATISELLERTAKNTKIIRTSIIGHEMNTHLSLLDWFLHSEKSVNGYTNHYWNGITTIEWAMQCEILINRWDEHSVMTQLGTNEIRSKYDLLLDAKDVYNKAITVVPFEAPIAVNKCLASDKEIKPIKTQLQELKEFYGK